MLYQHTLKEGNGTPFVFLHGFLGSMHDLEPLIHELKNKTCIGIDLPGHGNSSFTPHFEDKMPDLPSMHLVGYSMGGRLALKFREKYPEKVKSLTLLSAHLGLEKGHIQRLFLDRKRAKKIKSNFDAFLEEWYTQPLFGGFIPDLLERKKQNPTELAKALIYYSLARQKKYDLQNAKLLIGENDTKFRELYKTATVISGASHQIHLENPREVAKILNELE